MFLLVLFHLVLVLMVKLACCHIIVVTVSSIIDEVGLGPNF